MHGRDEHITLTEAAKITPGRPSTNCLWRWCRRGVLSRSGQRVRLQHIRIGGKIFTTAAWIQQFGEALAQADEAHFDLQEPVVSAEAGSPPAVPAPRRRRRTRRDQQRHRAHEQAERELEEAGL